ncbi:MAG: hypothetical protein LC655_02920 [Bacteroidales bacterium]|nr:hypothetical protein [Bacteroidales bacterium]
MRTGIFNHINDVIEKSSNPNDENRAPYSNQEIGFNRYSRIIDELTIF